MSRFWFFIHEAFRALRRNAAPSVAAIVTTVVTVILLGVLIPVFQTTQGKSQEVRNQLELKVFLYDDATKSETAALKSKLAGAAARQVGLLRLQARGAEDPQGAAQGPQRARGAQLEPAARPPST